MWKKLLDPHGYGLAIIVALALHIVIIMLFAIQWPEDKRQVAEPTPKNIQAKVIQIENKQVQQRKLAEQKRVEKNKRDQRRRQEAQRKKKLAQQKAAKDKARKEKAAQAKAKKLADKKQADKKKAAELKERELKEIAKKKALAQQEEQLAFEREQEEKLLEALAIEEQQRSMEKALADELQAQKNVAITNDVVAQIQAKIYRTWRYPPSARPDMTVIVKIQLVPTGEVINVTLTRGSGNEAVDRSVISAIKRAQPLPVPKDIRLFERQFRNFSMEFSPKDAVW